MGFTLSGDQALLRAWTEWVWSPKMTIHNPKLSHHLAQKLMANLREKKRTWSLVSYQSYHGLSPYITVDDCHISWVSVDGSHSHRPPGGWGSKAGSAGVGLMKSRWISSWSRIIWLWLKIRVPNDPPIMIMFSRKTIHFWGLIILSHRHL